jgi:hypothetical protein
MELRDARVGDAEDLADLLGGQIFVVVQGDDHALALGELADGVGQDLLGFRLLDLGLGVVALLILDEIEP